MRTISHQYQKPPNCIKQFHDALIDKNLIFSSVDLIGYGLDPIEDLDPAIKRALNTCILQHIPIEQHFKQVYLDNKGQLISGWRLSRMAMKLVIINASTNNPLVSRTQMQMIEGKIDL